METIVMPKYTPTAAPTATFELQTVRARVGSEHRRNRRAVLGDGTATRRSILGPIPIDLPVTVPAAVLIPGAGLQFCGDLRRFAPNKEGDVFVVGMRAADVRKRAECFVHTNLHRVDHIGFGQLVTVLGGCAVEDRAVAAHATEVGFALEDPRLPGIHAGGEELLGAFFRVAFEADVTRGLDLWVHHSLVSLVTPPDPDVPVSATAQAPAAAPSSTEAGADALGPPAAKRSHFA
jgi:hypothetical protein